MEQAGRAKMPYNGFSLVFKEFAHFTSAIFEILSERAIKAGIRVFAIKLDNEMIFLQSHLRIGCICALPKNLNFVGMKSVFID